MADHGMPFKAPMIRAILREIEQPGIGKTQTRRVLIGAWQHALDGHDEVLTWFAPAHVPKEGNNDWAESGIWARKHGPRGYNRHLGYVPSRPCDRLWVREEHFQFGHWEIEPGKLTKGGREKWCFVADRAEVLFTAPGEYRNGRHRDDPATPAWHKRLGRFMFRAHSRLTLYVSDVRVKRLQDISEADAVAEGVEPLHHGWFPYGLSTFMTTIVDGREVPAQCCRCARDSYAMLWNAINGPGAWEANPWVVAYTFTPRLGNIDALPDTLQEAA